MAFLVTGATGKAGGEVARRLLQEGHAVRVLTRDAARAVIPDGAQVVEGDLTRPDSLVDAFDGVIAAHLLTSDGDYAHLDSGDQIARLADKAGVRRVTLLWNGSAGPVERAFAQSALEWTRLEPVSFMGNSLEWAAGIRDCVTVEEPFVDSREVLVDESDIGAVSARVLVDGGHHGRTYSLTGPAPISARERVEELARVLGGDIRLVELSETEARERWRRAGHSDEMIERLVQWQSDPPREATSASPDVEQVLGRPARRFSAWAEAHVTAFR